MICLEYEEPITIHKMPRSNVSHGDYCFSNGVRYIHPTDRSLCGDSYYNGFTERDKLLDDAITRGNHLHIKNDLWRVYDDAILNYELNPINPYDWLFNHAKLNNKLVIVSIPRQRILLVNSYFTYIEYYDFIHGVGKHFMRYARPL